MRRGASQVNVDDALGLGLEMGLAWEEWVLGGFQSHGVRSEQMSQGSCAEPHPAVFQEVAAGIELNLFKLWIHENKRVKSEDRCVK